MCGLGVLVKDECFEYDGEERRRHCEMVVVLKTKLEEEIEKTSEFREYVMNSLRDIQISLKPLDEINVSYNRGKWIVSITVLALIGAIVTMSTRFIARHWN